MWYSVSPNDRGKFENMAQQLYPELARNCKAFLRHKDILISPRVLRAFNVPFQQARQEVGEFIVLSAAAYHSGFNQVSCSSRSPQRYQLFSICNKDWTCEGCSRAADNMRAVLRDEAVSACCRASTARRP